MSSEVNSSEINEQKEVLITLAKTIFFRTGKALTNKDLIQYGISKDTVKLLFGGIRELNILSGNPVSRESGMTDDDLKKHIENIAEIDENGCWTTNNIKANLDGRPQIRYKGRTFLLARVVYELFVEKLKPNLCLLHSCDNEKCFNPKHLRQGTKKDNSDDMQSRGRVKIGEKRILDNFRLKDPYDYPALLGLVQKRIFISEKEEWLYPTNSSRRSYPRIRINEKIYTLAKLILANKLGKKYEDVGVTCHRFPENSPYFFDKPAINDVNPDHLFEGDMSSNGNDAVAYSNNSHLSAQVATQILQEIRQLDLSEYACLAELENDFAQKYRVDSATIHGLITGIRYKNFQLNDGFDIKAAFSVANTKAVVQLKLDGTLIKRWQSITEITQKLNFERGGISLACKGKTRMYKNYKWEFEKDYEQKLLKEAGYLIIKNFFSKERINKIYTDAKRIFENQFQCKNYILGDENFEKNLFSLFRDDITCFINCGKQVQHLVSLHRLGVHGKLVRKLKDLGLEFPNISTRPTVFFNSKHLATKDIYHTIPPHQDIYSTQGSVNSVVVWLPLINVTKELGALQIIPRSHTNGILANYAEEGFGLVDGCKDADFLDVELDVGDILIFSTYLVHRSGNNITDSVRWSAHFRYNDLNDEDFITRKYPNPYIYKPISKDEK